MPDERSQLRLGSPDPLIGVRYLLAGAIGALIGFLWGAS